MLFVLTQEMPFFAPQEWRSNKSLIIFLPSKDICLDSEWIMINGDEDLLSREEIYQGINDERKYLVHSIYEYSQWGI